MENLNLSLIPKESIDHLLEEIQDIKSILNKKSEEEFNSRWKLKKEARMTLKVCDKTMDKLINNGIIPSSKFAGKTYIKQADIESFLESNYTGK